VPLTPEQQTQLVDVNLQINALPYSDVIGKSEGVDDWFDTPPTVADPHSWVCRDYVLMKADRLRILGWPKADLTVVLTWTEPPDRGYHAVLAVETGDASPMILDSRFDEPYRMDAPPADYQWDRRQVAGTTEFEAIA
jgi:predicted transglutaminase-like cysteine proteinase